MPTIRLSEKVKQKLDRRIEEEIRKEVKKNPRILTQAIKTKYGYTHSDFIDRLLESEQMTRIIRIKSNRKELLQ